ncbi:hypothetical protein ES703_101919 [subsurface metagenome]
MTEKEFKGYKGSGKILVMIPTKKYKKIPNYFFIKLDLTKIRAREKNEKRK